MWASLVKQITLELKLFKINSHLYEDFLLF